MEKLLAADFLRSLYSSNRQATEKGWESQKRLKMTVILVHINYNFLVSVLKKGYPNLAEIKSCLDKSWSFIHLSSPCCVFTKECSLALWTCLSFTTAFCSEVSLWQCTDTFSVCVPLSFAVTLLSQGILWAVGPSFAWLYPGGKMNACRGRQIGSKISGAAIDFCCFTLFWTWLASNGEIENIAGGSGG